MSHVRKQIRDAAVNALKGIEGFATNVFPSHIYPLDSHKLPGFCVYTMKERSEATSISLDGIRLDRSLELTVELYIKQAVGIDDKVDEISVEVEKALNSDGTLSGLIKSISPSEFDLSFDGAAEKPVAVATMKFDCSYQTIDNDPETSV